MSGKYKDNPLLDAIIKLKNNEKSGVELDAERKGSGQRARVPSDLSSIKNTLNKFDK